jgi:hypothetical protein
MLNLAQMVVQGLQLSVLLMNTECPLAKAMVLTTQPLQIQGRPDGMLLILVQMCTLFYHDASGVVLQVEQVLGLLHHRKQPLGADVTWAVLILDREQHDGHVSRVCEVLLTHRDECQVDHLLDGVIQVTSNNHLGPWCLGVNGDLQPNLVARQAGCLVGPAAVLRDQLIVAKTHERTQQHPGKTRAVSAHGTQLAIIAEGAVGVVVHVHLRMQNKKMPLSHHNQLSKEKR